MDTVLMVMQSSWNSQREEDRVDLRELKVEVDDQHAVTIVEKTIIGRYSS